MKTIILMGIKHCGKSTQARLLSQHFECSAYDTDDVITEITGKSPRQIYSEEGKEAFLEAEVKACLNVKSRIQGKMAVIATGGGICNNPKAVEILKEIGILVFLNAEENLASDRIIREVKINPDGTLSNMPAYIAKENPHSIEEVRAVFHNFYVERQKIYQSICNISVDMLPVTKSENMDSIIAALN